MAGTDGLASLYVIPRVADSPPCAPCDYCHLNLKGVERCRVCNTQICQARRMVLESRCFRHFCLSSGYPITEKCGPGYGQRRRSRVYCQYCHPRYSHRKTRCPRCGSAFCKPERVQIEMDCAMYVIKKQSDAFGRTLKTDFWARLAAQLKSTIDRFSTEKQQLAILMPHADTEPDFLCAAASGTARRKLEIRYYAL